ncbi:MAG: hypothetical protein AAB554_00975 [Patescibacteria group bacterium]
MRNKRETARFLNEALEAASFGFDVLLTTRSHQRVLAGQGLEGICRVVTERRARETRAWLRAAKRARLIKITRAGDRMKVALAPKGRRMLLEMRIRSAPRLRGAEKTYVAFDFPIPQRSARDAFRRFLKRTGFIKIQMSLWSIGRDAAKPMRDLLTRVGARDWVRVFHGTEKTA